MHIIIAATLAAFISAPASAQGLIERLEGLERAHVALAEKHKELQEAHDLLAGQHRSLKSDYDGLKSNHGGLASHYQTLESAQRRMRGQQDDLQTALHGSILASVTPCRQLGSRWAVYKGGVGRFLLGVTDGYELGSRGGAPTVRLSEAQMPKHTHLFDYAMSDNDGTQENFLAKEKADERVNTYRPWLRTGLSTSGRWMANKRSGAIRSAGSGKAFKIMPPYRVVHFCTYNG